MNPRIAVVTGGIGGIGTAICLALARAGHKVIAVDLPAAPERLATFDAAMSGGDVHFEAGDVSDFHACAELVQRIESKHGPIDILVNGAGITRDASFRKMTPAEWDAVLRVNLDSVFNVCKAAAELLELPIVDAPPPAPAPALVSPEPPRALPEPVLA